MLIPPAALVRAVMERRPEWKLVYSDSDAMLFARWTRPRRGLTACRYEGSRRRTRSPEIRACDGCAFARLSLRIVLSCEETRHQVTPARGGAAADTASGRPARANGILAAARGEVAEPGLRRTPGERVNSEGFRGFKSPPLRHAVSSRGTNLDKAPGRNAQ